VAPLGLPVGAAVIISLGRNEGDGLGPLLGDVLVDLIGAAEAETEGDAWCR
jgi:hypothetical protein